MHKMPTAHHADQYQGRCAASETAWPPGVFVARSAGSRNSSEDVQPVETRWVLATQTLLHILIFCCFPVLHYIAPFVISHQVKALGHFSPVFQQCPDLRCQKMWLLHATVTPWVMNNNNTKDVCLCYSCSSARLFVLFFSLYLLGHKF